MIHGKSMFKLTTMEKIGVKDHQDSQRALYGLETFGKPLGFAEHKLLYIVGTKNY